jgi:hypothetical protein
MAPPYTHIIYGWREQKSESKLRQNYYVQKCGKNFEWQMASSSTSESELELSERKSIIKEFEICAEILWHRSRSDKTIK